MADEHVYAVCSMTVEGYEYHLHHTLHKNKAKDLLDAEIQKTLADLETRGVKGRIAPVTRGTTNGFIVVYYNTTMKMDEIWREFWISTYPLR